MHFPHRSSSRSRISQIFRLFHPAIYSRVSPRRFAGVVYSRREGVNDPTRGGGSPSSARPNPSTTISSGPRRKETWSGRVRKPRVPERYEDDDARSPRPLHRTPHCHCLPALASEKLANRLSCASSLIECVSQTDARLYSTRGPRICVLLKQSARENVVPYFRPPAVQESAQDDSRRSFSCPDQKSYSKDFWRTIAEPRQPYFRQLTDVRDRVWYSQASFDFLSSGTTRVGARFGEPRT